MTDNNGQKIQWEIRRQKIPKGEIRRRNRRMTGHNSMVKRYQKGKGEIRRMTNNTMSKGEIRRRIRRIDNSMVKRYQRRN